MELYVFPLLCQLLFIIKMQEAPRKVLPHLFFKQELEHDFDAKLKKEL